MGVCVGVGVVREPTHAPPENVIYVDNKVSLLDAGERRLGEGVSLIFS